MATGQFAPVLHIQSSASDGWQRASFPMIQLTHAVQVVSEPGEQGLETAPMWVSNQKIAKALFNISTLLDMRQANHYRITAYRSAAPRN